MGYQLSNLKSVTTLWDLSSQVVAHLNFMSLFTKRTSPQGNAFCLSTVIWAQTTSRTVYHINFLQISNACKSSANVFAFSHINYFTPEKQNLKQIEWDGQATFISILTWILSYLHLNGFMLILWAWCSGTFLKMTSVVVCLIQSLSYQSSSTCKKN